MIRFRRCLAVAFLSLPLFAQQKGGAPKSSAKAAAPAKAAGPVLTAEGYRDLIVNTADAMRDNSTYGQVTPGTGTVTVSGQQIPCIGTFTITESAAQNVANRRKEWARARVPKALEESHVEILKWMESAESTAKEAPACFLPMLQASVKQFGFLTLSVEYDKLRQNAATALAGMGVTLPPIAKPTPDKK